MLSSSPLILYAACNLLTRTLCIYTVEKLLVPCWMRMQRKEEKKEGNGAMGWLEGNSLLPLTNVWVCVCVLMMMTMERIYAWCTAGNKSVFRLCLICKHFFSAISACCHAHYKNAFYNSRYIAIFYIVCCLMKHLLIFFPLSSTILNGAWQ